MFLHKWRETKTNVRLKWIGLRYQLDWLQWVIWVKKKQELIARHWFNDKHKFLMSGNNWWRRTYIRTNGERKPKVICFALTKKSQVKKRKVSYSDLSVIFLVKFGTEGKRKITQGSIWRECTVLNGNIPLKFFL